MQAHESHARARLRRGRPLGTPAHLQHDVHRPFGWSRELGLYIDSEMVRVLGQIEIPEGEEEIAQLQARIAEYWESYHRDAAEPYREELSARLEPADLSNAQFLRMEAVFMKRPNIAAEAYPDFFTPE